MIRLNIPKVNLLKTNVAPIPKEVRKKLKKKSTIPEAVIQRQVDEYLALLGVRPIRIPDSLYRSIYAQKSVPIHVKANIAKHIAGLPDLLIPRLTDKGLMILPLELKTESGKLGPKQVKWQQTLGTKVAHSFDEAKELIDEFLKEK